LVYGQQQLSYSELDDRAHQFSARLLQLGVVPGDTVALCMERSFEWIIAALAIMRAGAAYVPLDALANELLSNRIDLGHIDIVADFALPLPAIVTAKLMGLPIEDHSRLSHWVSDIAEVHGNFMHHPHRIGQILKRVADR
jgi:acyl-CoA synthetase (AMP-forming)/AMP-acid ligase II